MAKILAFAGSNHSASINRILVEHAARMLRNQEGIVIDLRDFDAPIFSQDLEEEQGIPDSIQRLRGLFDEHDAFLIASPEHNGMMPAFFKNLMDWLSRMEGKIFQGKPVMLISASPGPRGGKTNLQNMAAVIPHWGASAVFTGFHVSRFYEAYDAAASRFTNPDDEQRLRDAMNLFENSLSD
jgi:NAD(P)H-dependent FMN reductase